MTANDIGQYWDNQSWFRGKGASALVPVSESSINHLLCIYLLRV